MLLLYCKNVGSFSQIQYKKTKMIKKILNLKNQEIHNFPIVGFVGFVTLFGFVTLKTFVTYKKKLLYCFKVDKFCNFSTFRFGYHGNEYLQQPILAFYTLVYRCIKYKERLGVISPVRRLY